MTNLIGKWGVSEEYKCEGEVVAIVFGSYGSLYLYLRTDDGKLRQTYYSSITIYDARPDAQGPYR